jgi:hypothetical protein
VATNRARTPQPATGRAQLAWQSGHTVCLDLGLRTRRSDPFVVSDLDEAGWVERFTVPDPSLAPDGEKLIQAQMPIRPGEAVEAAATRLEQLLDLALPERAGRETWRRRQIMKDRTGALDLPGQTWHDRPAVDRGDGVFLAGDMVAKPGRGRLRQRPCSRARSAHTRPPSTRRVAAINAAVRL